MVLPLRIGLGDHTERGRRVNARRPSSLDCLRDAHGRPRAVRASDHTPRTVRLPKTGNTCQPTPQPPPTPPCNAGPRGGGKALPARHALPTNPRIRPHYQRAAATLILNSPCSHLRTPSRRHRGPFWRRRPSQHPRLHTPSAPSQCDTMAPRVSPTRLDRNRGFRFFHGSRSRSGPQALLGEGRGVRSCGVRVDPALQRLGVRSPPASSGHN